LQQKLVANPLRWRIAHLQRKIRISSIPLVFSGKTISMKRGEVWTSASTVDYGSKPRPVVIIQDDRFHEIDSITICPLTSDPISASYFRLPIMPNDENGLLHPCRIMVDKITTVPRTKLRSHIGRLHDEDMVRLNRTIMVFLGIAGMMPDEDPADE